MDESIERVEVPEATTPPSIADIRTMIMEMGLATSDEVQAIAGRVQELEKQYAELPKVYASADSVTKVKTSQAGQESNLRKLTEQVAGLANVQADSQQKFTSIKNDMSTMKTQVETLTGSISGMTGNLNTFMRTQDERLNHQQTIITEAKMKADALTEEVATVKKEFNPVHDFIVGSDTQKPIKETLSSYEKAVSDLRASVSQNTAESAVITEYVKAQKEKEAAHVSFRQRIYLQMFTKTGFALMVGSIFLLIVLAQSIDLERSFVWLRNAAALFGVKVG